MEFIKGVWNGILKLYFLKCSDERRIRYLRKLGVRIGDKCRIRTLKFSSEPYLIEIGNHVAVAAGTEFITHDGANWVFEADVDGGGIFGKITIGNNVVIGANATVYKDVPDNSTVLPGSSKIMRWTSGCTIKMEI